MTIDERIEKTMTELNILQEQIHSIDQQMLNLQKQRENALAIYRRAEGALAVLRDIKDEAKPPVSDEEQT